jgi:hypothetical protein
MTDTTPNERQLAADLVSVLQGIARADAANTGELCACAHRVGRHAARLIVMQYAKTPGQFLWIAETRTDWLAAFAAEVSAYLETAAENAEAVAAAGEVLELIPKTIRPSDHEGNGWDDIDTSGQEVVL